MSLHPSFLGLLHLNFHHMCADILGSRDQNTLWAHVDSLSALAPSFSQIGKGGARGREGRKEEMTSEKTILPICGTCCECVFFTEERECGVFFCTRRAAPRSGT